MESEYRCNLWHRDRFRFWAIALLVVWGDFLIWRSVSSGSLPLTAFYLGSLLVCWPRRLNFLSGKARLLWDIQFFLCGLGIFVYADWFALLLGYASLLVFRMVCREERAECSVRMWLLKLLIGTVTLPAEVFYQFITPAAGNGENRKKPKRAVRAV